MCLQCCWSHLPAIHIDSADRCQLINFIFHSLQPRINRFTYIHTFMSLSSLDTRLLGPCRMFLWLTDKQTNIHTRVNIVLPTNLAHSSAYVTQIRYRDSINECKYNCWIYVFDMKQVWNFIRSIEPHMISNWQSKLCERACLQYSINGEHYSAH
jgi:hypothetical protein